MSIISTGLTITSSYGSWYIGELPIRADETSVNQYCVEKGYVSGGTFTQDNGRWANDGNERISEPRRAPGPRMHTDTNSR